MYGKNKLKAGLLIFALKILSISMMMMIDAYQFRKRKITILNQITASASISQVSSSELIRERRLKVTFLSLVLFA